MNERKIQDERLLDIARTNMGKCLAALHEAQDKFAGIMAGRTILLVDTMGGGWHLASQEIDALRARGGVYAQLAYIYTGIVFGGQSPRSVTDMFQRFFGDTVKIVTQDIRAKPAYSDTPIDAVVFTGSPASIWKAHRSDLCDQEIRSGVGITHRQVFLDASAIYAEARAKDLPVIGVCYGHQVISNIHGGRVVRLRAAENGMIQVEIPDGYATKLMMSLFGELPFVDGAVASYHIDEVVPNSKKSALFVCNNNCKPAMIHGLIHIVDKEFSEDGHKDGALVRSLLEVGRHVAMTVQYHPEEIAAEALISRAAGNDDTVYEASHDRVLAAETLEMFGNFLSQHKRFA